MKSRTSAVWIESQIIVEIFPGRKKSGGLCFGECDPLVEDFDVTIAPGTNGYKK